MSYLRHFIIFFLFLCLVFINSSFGQQKSLADIYKTGKVRFVPEITIDDSTLPKDVFFVGYGDIAVDGDGNVYVLDSRAKDIKKFDASGTFLKLIGREGQGPGEFGMPISLFLSQQNQIIVNDMGRRKIQYFDREGNYLKEFSIADKFLFFGPMVTSVGDLVATYTIPQEEPVTVLQKFNPEFESILSFASIPLDAPPVVNIFVARSLTSLRWAVTYYDEIIWADIKNPEYEIRFHDTDGKLKRIITRDYDPLSITAEDKDRLIEETFGDNPTRDQWDVRFPHNYPPFSGFSFDDLGRFFVRRYEKETHEEGNLYDIFDSEGRFIAQVRLKMNPMIWKKGHMYTIKDDAEGFKAVMRYKVDWKI